MKLHVRAEYSEGSYIITFAVTDTGIGIAKEDHNKLFRPFTQIDGGTNKEEPGVGIGLVISRELCGLFGGEMWFESQKDHGSTFYFTINVPEYVGSLPVNSTVNMAHLKGKKILVVDDKEENRKYLQLTLFKWQMIPYLFASGGEVLNFMEFSGCQFDLGLLDICMPRVTGDELAKKLRDTIKCDFPLIALSSFGDKNEKNDYFVGQISKPIHEERLLKLMHQHLHHSVRTDDKKEKKCKWTQNVSILIAEDIYLNQKMIRSMLQKLGFVNMELVSNGQEVLDKLKTKTYDLIFMDLRMPIVDGLVASKKIYDMYGDKRPKIIALTANAHRKDKEKYIKQGYIDSYLIKPIDLATLQFALEKILL